MQGSGIEDADGAGGVEVGTVCVVKGGRGGKVNGAVVDRGGMLEYV